MFMQVDRTSEHSQGGLGIGLTLVKRLVEMHGGSIEARSEGEGLGSEFIVRLPAITKPAASATVTDNGTEESTGRRVLIVDDNHDSAEMLQNLMEMSGHTAHIAHDGVSAVPAALKTRPDVILLDIGLPGKDGYQLVKELCSLPEIAAARIVATTGYGRAEDRARCLAAGFDAHLTKPIDYSALAEVLARH